MRKVTWAAQTLIMHVCQRFALPMNLTRTHTIDRLESSITETIEDRLEEDAFRAMVSLSRVLLHPVDRDKGKEYIVGHQVFSSSVPSFLIHPRH